MHFVEEEARGPCGDSQGLVVAVAALVGLLATSLWTFHVQMQPNFQFRLAVSWTVKELGATLAGGEYVLVRKFGVFKLACQLWRHRGRDLALIMYAFSCVWPHVKLALVAALVVRARYTRIFDRRFHALTFCGRLAFVDFATVVFFVAVARFTGSVDMAPFVADATPTMHFDLLFVARPARGIFQYVATIVVSQLLTHGVITVLEGLDPGAPAAAIAEANVFLDEDRKPFDYGKDGGATKTKALARDAVVFLDDDLREPADLGKTLCVVGIAGGGAALLGYFLAFADGPPVMTWSFESTVDVSLGDILDLPLPAVLRDQVLLHFHDRNDHAFSTWSIIAATKQTLDGVPPAPKALTLFHLANALIVVAPIARVLGLGVAVVVPSRFFRVALRSAIDIVSILIAADAFLIAIAVAIADTRPMLSYFTGQNLPPMLGDSLAVDVRANQPWFFALLVLVFGEALVSHRIARPVLDAMIREDWRGGNADAAVPLLHRAV